MNRAEAWVRSHPATRPPGTLPWAASLGLHSGLVLVALLLGARGHKDFTPPIPDHVQVSMVALPRKANELPDKVMVRAPDPGATGKVEVKRPEPERMVLPEPDLAPDKGKDPDPEEPPPATPVPDRSRRREELLRLARADLMGPETHLPSDPDGQDSEDEVAENLSTGVYNPQLSKYRSKVRYLISENWNPLPQILKDNPDLKVVIFLRIDAEGAILDPVIQEESGNPSFDASALRAVQRTAKLPLPPDDLQADAEKGFVVSFSPEDKGY